MTTTPNAVATPTDLAVYRDDGLAGLLAAGRRSGRENRLTWLVPPVLRVVEYGALLALTLAVEPAALPACFALLSALAFHHYDTVYRLRHQRIAPPRWVGLAAGGWAARLLVAGGLAALGWLGAGMWVAAAVLGTLFVAESMSSWRRFTQPATLYETEEDEQE